MDNSDGPSQGDIIRRLEQHEVPIKHIEEVSAKGNWNWLDVVKIKYGRKLKLGKHKYDTSYIKFKPLMPIDFRVVPIVTSMPFLSNEVTPYCNDAAWDILLRQKYKNHVEFIKKQAGVTILRNTPKFIETKKVEGEYMSNLLMDAAVTLDYPKIAEQAKHYGKLLREFHDDNWSMGDPNPFDVIWDKKKKQHVLTDGDFARKVRHSSDFKRVLELMFNYFSAAKLLSFGIYRKKQSKRHLEKLCSIYLLSLVEGYGNVNGLKRFGRSGRAKMVMLTMWILANYFTRHFRSLKLPAYGFMRAYRALRKYSNEI